MHHAPHWAIRPTVVDFSLLRKVAFGLLMSFDNELLSKIWFDIDVITIERLIHII